MYQSINDIEFNSNNSTELLEKVVNISVNSDQTNQKQLKTNKASYASMILFVFIIMNFMSLVIDIFQNGYVNFNKEKNCSFLSLQIFINSFVIMTDILFVHVIELIIIKIIDKKNNKLKFLLVCQTIIRNFVILFLMTLFHEYVSVCNQESQNLSFIWIIYIINLLYDLCMIVVQCIFIIAIIAKV